MSEKLTWPERFRAARWRKAEAERQGAMVMGENFFTHDDIRCANEWTCCAVGETMPVVGEAFDATFFVYDPPEHPILTLGCRFAGYVGVSGNVGKAEEIYDEIAAFAATTTAEEVEDAAMEALDW